MDKYTVTPSQSIRWTLSNDPNSLIYQYISISLWTLTEPTDFIKRRLWEEYATPQYSFMEGCLLRKTKQLEWSLAKEKEVGYFAQNAYSDATARTVTCIVEVVKKWITKHTMKS